jgi:hypothetical protein
MRSWSVAFSVFLACTSRMLFLKSLCSHADILTCSALVGCFRAALVDGATTGRSATATGAVRPLLELSAFCRFAIFDMS